nr:MAG: RNA-dependent RNA polymerase [Alternaria tenuissima negative-stranded RNA virus 2]
MFIFPKLLASEPIWSDENLSIPPVSTFYPSENHQLPKFSCEFSDDLHTLTVGFDGPDDTVSMLSGGHQALQIEESKARNLHHDFVISPWAQQTDVRLDNIYPPLHDGKDNKTPDALLSTDPITILELATTRNGQKEYMKRKSLDKIHTYYEALKARAISFNRKTVFYVLVVSPTCVCSNAPLAQNVVDLLTFRFRFMLSLRATIVTKTNRDWFYVMSQSLQTSDLKVMLNSLPLKFDETFNEQFWNQCTNFFVEEEKVKDALIIAVEEARRRTEESWIPRTLENYFDEIIKEPTRLESKNIVPFPSCLPLLTECSDAGHDFFEQGYIPWSSKMSALEEIWHYAIDHVRYNEKEYAKNDITSVLEEALSDKDDATETVFHKKQRTAFTPKLSYECRVQLALSGVEGKAMSDDPVVAARRLEEKKGLDPNTPVDDVSRILEESFPFDEPGFEDRMPVLERTIEESNICEPVKEFFNFYKNSTIGLHSRFVSDVVNELILSARTNVFQGQFLIKKLKRWECYLLIKPTNFKNHIFFSLGMKGPLADLSFDVDNNVFTPTLKVDEFLLTPFRSMKMDRAGHLVKAEAMMMECMALVFEMSGIVMKGDMNTMDYSTSLRCNPQASRNLMFQYLTFLENKPITEEVITLTRYAYMEAFKCPGEPIKSSKIIDKYPSVIRSRLQLWYMHQTSKLCSYLESGGVYWSVEEGKWEGLVDPVTLHPVEDVNYVIRSFYTGYLCSKELSGEKNGMLKMTEKIFVYEQKYRKTLKERGNLHLSEPAKLPSWHEYSPAFVSFIARETRDHLERSLGLDWSSQVEDAILCNWASSDFAELTTLKASARFKGQKLTELSVEGLKELKDDGLENRRPKVVQAFLNLRQELRLDDAERLTDFIVPCLDLLNSKGSIFVDLFKKPQHGGLREIYVIEIAARIIQLFLEKISRVMCSYFPSEVMMHPKNKYEIPLKHGRDAQKLLGQFVTLSYAADAAKWNQAHFVPKFAEFLIKTTPPCFHTFIFRSVQLWKNKKIQMPLELIESFLKHPDIKTGSQCYSDIRRLVFSGKEGDIIEAGSLHMNIESGMMQGILHYLSSFFHTAYIQWLCKEVSACLLAKKIKHVISHQQSSDDSSLIISIKEGSFNAMTRKYFRYIFHLKDTLGRYMGIFESFEKSTPMLLNTVEFNSEYFFHNCWVRPTNRWVYACQTIEIVESFIDRMEQNANLLQSVLEGGGTTWLTSICQISQALLHYRLIGMDTNVLSNEYQNRIIECKEPGFGYYPLTPSLVAGMLGFRYDLYCLSRDPAMSKSLKRWIGSPEEMRMGGMTKLGSRLKSCQIQFGDRKLYWDMIDSLGVGSGWRDEVEMKPDVLFKRAENKSELDVQIMYKMISPGVVESLSKFSPIARLIAASVYMLNKHTFTLGHGWSSWKNKKYSLMQILNDQEPVDEASEVLSEEEERRLFPSVSQYREVSRVIQEFEGAMLSPVEIQRRARTQIEIFHPELIQLYPLETLVRRKWFDLEGPPVSDSLFNTLWDEQKLTYPWLRDSWIETREALDCSSIELANLIKRLNFSKSRTLFLTNTTGKSAGHFGLSNLISRCFFLNKKLIFQTDQGNVDIIEERGNSRANFLHGLYCLHMMPFTSTEFCEEFRALVEANPFIVEGDLSNQGKLLRLHIICKFAIGELVGDQLLSAVRRSKSGVLGSFKVVQRSTGKSEYHGRGMWSGMIGETFVEIHAMGDQVQKIKVSTMANFRELHPLLRVLLREFGWVVKAQKKLESGMVVYNTTQGFGMSSLKGVPVEVTTVPRLQDDGIDPTGHFEIRRHENRVRVVYIPPMSSRPYTIISFSSAPKHYIQFGSTTSKNPLYRSMVTGQQLELSTFHTITHRAEKVVGSWAEIRKNHCLDGYNLISLKDIFQHYFRQSFRLQTNSRVPDELIHQEAYRGPKYTLKDLVSGRLTDIINNAIAESMMSEISALGQANWAEEGDDSMDSTFDQIGTGEMFQYVETENDSGAKLISTHQWLSKVYQFYRSQIPAGELARIFERGEVSESYFSSAQGLAFWMEARAVSDSKQFEPVLEYDRNFED